MAEYSLMASHSGLRRPRSAFFYTVIFAGLMAFVVVATTRGLAETRKVEVGLSRMGTRNAKVGGMSKYGIQRSMKTRGFMDDFEKGFNEFMFGWKEDRWNPDRRTEAEKGSRVGASTSSLSWGQRDWQEEAQENLMDFIKGEKYPLRVATDVLDESGAFDSSTDLEINEQLVARMRRKGENRYIAGRKLAEMIFAKYGKYHDVTLLQAKPFGSGDQDRQVALNIYGPHLGNPSFPYSESQYLQKLDGIAHMLNSWDQAWYVQEFLESRLKPRRGLPSRPRADTAVTLRLNQSPTWSLVPPQQVAEVFSW